jgi:RNA polymerase sporulation-specific sigma factor
MANKVEICGVDTSKLRILTEDEKVRLLEKIKEGDKIAREEFIKGNLRLVLSIVHRFNSAGENIDDLFQIGCIGLIKAIDNFDLSLNVRFSTYAVPMIQGELRRYLRDNKTIRVSRSMRDIAYRAIYTKEHLMKNSIKEPSVGEIAEAIGVNREDVVTALDAVQSPMSLYEVVCNDGSDALYVMDHICDKKCREERWVEDISIGEAIKKLDERERNIIDLRFFEGKTQIEVAEEIGISQAQVSRLEKSALHHMRRYV